MDFDIDKAFLLGYAVDGNGKFIGWSSLFDYSSKEGLRKSLMLPYPNGRSVQVITSNNQTADVILTRDLITDVTNILNTNKSKVTVTNIGDSKYLNQLNMAIRKHQNTIIPELNKSNSLKNFILSRIINIIQDARNFVSAYTPTSTDEIQSAADNSPKGKDANSYNLLNPLSLYHMQSENLVGKKVIGIGANGSKVQNLLNYFQNEMLRGDKYQQNKAKFNISFNRIKGRSTGNPKPVNINLTPGANIPEGIEANVLNPEITTDNASSQFISAATDNAKLLILSKINAGDKLAKCYVYLINLGFDYSDIVSFMTSPIVSFIDSVTNSNIYCGNVSVQGLVNFIQRNLTQIQGNKLDEIVFPRWWKISDKYKSFILNSLNDKLKDPDNVLDLLEFSSILAGANEFTNASNNLSINQGIPTDRPSIDKKLKYLKDAFTSSNGNIRQTLEDTYGITGEEAINIEGAINATFGNNGSKFDPKLWLRNVNVTYKDSKGNTHTYSYRDLTRYTKEANKISVNIFEMIENLPHIKAMFDGLFIVDYITGLSSKTKLYDKVMNSVYCKGNTYKDQYLNKVESEIDRSLVYNFLVSKKFRFPTNPDYKTQLINSLGNITEFTEDNIGLDSVLGQMRFKHYFETVFIPKLKSGEYYNGKEVIQDNNLANNSFIQGLMLSQDPSGIPFYKLDVNMMQSEKVGSQNVLYNRYKRGFSQLTTIKIGDRYSIADWFRLYSLIINQGKNGEERLTKIVKEYSTDDSITTQYDDFLGTIDFPTFDINQLQFSPLSVLISAAPVSSYTTSSNYPIVYFSGNNNLRPGYYNDGVELKIFPEIAGEDDGQRAERIGNLKKYNVLNIYDVQSTQSLQDCLENIDTNIEEAKKILIEQLRDSLQKGLITLTQSCK